MLKRLSILLGLAVSAIIVCASDPVPYHRATIAGDLPGGESGRLAKQDEAVVEASLCDVTANPAKYDHKLIKITGDVSQGFEDFTVSSTRCKSHDAVWLDYGGKRSAGTKYCCGVTADKTRKTALTIEGVETRVQANEVFEAFDAQIHRFVFAGEAKNAVLVGRFFSGKKVEYPGGPRWSGFGHFGFYSLLVIQQVESFDKTVEQENNGQ